MKDLAGLAVILLYLALNIAIPVLLLVALLKFIFS